MVSTRALPGHESAIRATGGSTAGAPGTGMRTTIARAAPARFAGRGGRRAGHRDADHDRPRRVRRWESFRRMGSIANFRLPTRGEARFVPHGRRFVPSGGGFVTSPFPSGLRVVIMTCMVTVRRRRPVAERRVEPRRRRKGGRTMSTVKRGAGSRGAGSPAGKGGSAS